MLVERYTLMMRVQNLALYVLLSRGDKIMDYAGEHGFGLTMTCRRDRLPKDVPSTYWHKERTDSSQ